MPKVNIYLSPNKKQATSQSLVVDINIKKIKEYIAQKLSCHKMFLTADDISIRVIKTMNSNGMTAPVEIDIIAYNFSERILKKDNTSVDIAKYFQNEIFLSQKKPSVLLILSELGAG